VLANEPAREEGGKFYAGGPRAYFVQDAFPYGTQQELRSEGKETCWEDEIESYCFPEADEGKAVGELPDKRCADHAIDTGRYVWTWAWGKDMSQRPGLEKPKPGTYAELFGTVESLWRDRLKEMRRALW